ncbi:hypothetical protein TcasGA2_TC002002 [Tribolium castaneum]|uniref:Fibronectin type-III domain-containing protein n=1 Tax=Tribolium castaneum TaxID=7070 RepID=D7EHY5_TRICA|nr:PREDICTED: activating transcription factor 7-interacting protein 2 isoform X3 [Tribolium castaneum]XP_008199658.1 PREDICTED: activating transcription factor 7-interacting protein 2 isoform X3 [Tribolium castaneum]XP_008199659.1 PREDICTED: activating transcription factor 7-interacting protein 2 isoform X3 [Tribolium castaneum]EFA12694.2 hypothetical protein TcasGA2_TC002002 [Tribolium castaneum]|eukprot:XP_008199657.1 PREDICTED: activating transcription factor 7-interacting protein 2 isoform X3 [Tribolium castaneum]
MGIHEGLAKEITKIGNIIRSNWSRESLVEHKKQLELNLSTQVWIEETKPQFAQTYAEEVAFDGIPDVFPKEENTEQDPLEIIGQEEASTSETFDKNKTLLSLSKFLKTKNNSKKVTIEDLQQFCKEKKCKVIVCKNDTRELSAQLKMQQQIIETMDKKIEQISKKVDQLEQQQNTTQGPFRLDISRTFDSPTSEACTILLPSRKPEPANQLIKPPTRPILSARKVGKDVVLKWRMPYCSSKVYAPVASYEVYCYILNGSKRWRRMSKVESSELSMTFTLKNIDDDLIYYFGVRAIDVYKRRGLFSTEVTINNSKISSGCS